MIYLAHSNQKESPESRKTPGAVGGQRIADEQRKTHPIEYNRNRIGYQKTETNRRNGSARSTPTNRRGVTLSKPTINTKLRRKQTQRHR